jgi:flagellar hook-associated protein 2
MPGLQLAGLASGFDWKSLVDQLMAVERTPITRVEREKTQNTSQVTSLGGLGTRLTTLQGAVSDLQTAGLFSARKSASTTAGSGWTSSVASASAVGNHAVAVSQLASPARRDGAANIANGISATNDVSGATIATLATASAVTAGTFSVNGQKVTVATTDTLQDVFDAIGAATAGSVTAGYDAGNDKVTLGGTGTITLGAANDTSNFLSVMKLAQNGTSTVGSATALGTAKTASPLASAGLTAAITAVDGEGAGSFTINGVSISYNVNNDSLGAVLNRINQAGAGISAAYDSINDRVVLTNTATGDIDLHVSEAAGGLMNALGLTTGATAVAGRNALFTVNGGSTLSSASNTLGASVHGVTGLEVTVNSETTQTIQVTSDTAAMRGKIEALISAFNGVQSYIEDVTKVTVSAGKVTGSVLSGNREVQEWARSLRSNVFAAVPGLGGTIQRLENLGIDFTSGTNSLVIKDGAKLDAALRDSPVGVAAFFQTASTGLGAKLGTLITSMVDSNSGLQTRLTERNANLDRQIGDMERRLTQQRSLLEAGFIAMESAQAVIQQQGQALTNAFSTPTKK